MKSKTMILMGVAVVCGLGASYMTSRLIAERNETVAVLIAKQSQRAFTLIKEPAAMFEPKEIPRNEVPKNAVLNMDDLKDRILLKGIAEGQPVVADDLESKDKLPLDQQIKPGMRLVAIRTDAASASGGFVLPGSHVDVYHAIRIGERPDAKLLLEDIMVRAVDLATARPEDKAGVVPATVTLEVTPEQALTLTSVKDLGMLTLGLRSPRDDKKSAATETNVVKTVVPPPPPSEPKTEAAPKSEPPVEQKSLLIYNGTQWTRATFTTKNGEMTTAIEHGKDDAGAGPAPLIPPPPPAKTSPGAEAPKVKGSAPEPGLVPQVPPRTVKDPL